VERREALQHAIDEISRQRAEIQRLRRGAREPIAIVGMACRLPGAANVDEYWELLARGSDAVTEVPAERWNAAAFYDADASAAGKMATRHGAFIRGVDQFDPQFFGIAPREAQSMDPQQRLLLEVAWEALEQSNIAPSRLHGSATGVFVGITCFDHAIRISRAAENFNAYAGTGSALNMAPGRLSYVFGLTGPSMAIDTACSSSLVGLHLACQSLGDRESDAAMVGGVHLILSPHVMVSFSQARMLSPDGRSKTFDASADGYSRGEGCGVVVLKRLADAVADGDTILGVIRGTAVNQDGPSGGLTVPNGMSQQAVIRRALDVAGVSPSDIDYVEAHGTGTPLGDPIEIEALASVYGAGRAQDRPLLVGSVKTNIGHLEPAAGMAALIKVLLAFRHGVLPRHLHVTTPNPHIPWNELPIKVASAATTWPGGDRPRMAGVSAFGFSGTNAHVIVQEPPTATEALRRSARAHQPQLIPLSAKTESALKMLASRYAGMLARGSEVELASVAYTAGIGRAHFAYRLAVVAETIDAARAELEAFAADPASSAARTGKAVSAEYRRDAKDVTARLARAYESRALGEIATLYLQGIEIDWARLFADDVPPRVPLPAYPFERQRYWIDTPDTLDRDATPTGGVGRFELRWTSAGPAGKAIPPLGHRRWEIVADAGDQSPAETLAGSLAGALPPRDPASSPTDIIFIAGGGRDIARASVSCARLLELVHQVSTAGGVAPRVWVVTRGALPVGGAMTPAGAIAAPVAAFARVIGLEHPELFGRLIDLDIEPALTDATALLAEIGRDGAGDVDDQVALRSGERFVQRVERVVDSLRPAAPLRPDAAYLITGGVGRIGARVASDLARRGARHICLVSRRGVSTAEQRDAVAAIESAGASVRVAAVDVADRDAMAALIREIVAERPIAGVVHAAGVPGYTHIAELTAESVADVLRPKVHGAWNLHDLTRGLPLDFFVAFSSIASAWGSRGQAHYAAGNAFLDALAYLRRAEGLPAVSINWGPWLDGGMMSADAETLLRRVGIRPLPTAEALAAFGPLATGERAQIIVADIDMALFKGSYEARGHRPLLERLTVPGAEAVSPDAAAGSAFVRQLAAMTPAGRERLLIDAVRREVAQVLELGGAADADPDQGLFEMGLDSLMALELRTRLETLVARSLPATLVFDYPTINAIARLLARDGASSDAGPAARVASPGSSADVSTKAIDDLTEAEAEALLLQKLDAIH
jgi:3-oxoacyl-(acyl-carrier-protein) synthase/NAD(P)-dependent dehydrogenase (short-subunit alcohol dehydrogenase family)/acyl carrier protein